MKVFTETIDGIDGTKARLDCYVIDNSEEMDTKRKRVGVLLIPGGGYVMTSDREAEPVALRLLSYGYNVFILRYSCWPSVFPVSFLQAAEAMHRIRTNAEQWHVDPHAVAVMGFSAGGHLAGLLTTQFDAPELTKAGYKPEEMRPDAAILGYSVLDAGKWTHHSSIEHLVGKDKASDPAIIDRLSLQKHVSSHTPPVFLWHTATDDTVPVQNSLMFASSCVENNVPVELHIFPQGGHGLSLGTCEDAISGWHNYGIEPAIQPWPRLMRAWMSRLFPNDDYVTGGVLASGPAASNPWGGSDTSDESASSNESASSDKSSTSDSAEK